MIIAAQPGSGWWIVSVVLFAMTAIAALLARRWLREASEVASRAEERHRLILREYDLAHVVGELAAAVQNHNVALGGLRDAQAATHGAVARLLHHVHGNTPPDGDEEIRGVVLLTLFGSPFRGDA